MMTDSTISQPGVGHLKSTSERHAKSGERGMSAFNSLVRNIENRREHLFSRYQQKCQQKRAAGANFYLCFQCIAKIFARIRNRANSLR